MSTASRRCAHVVTRRERRSRNSQLLSMSNPSFINKCGALGSDRRGCPPDPSGGALTFNCCRLLQSLRRGRTRRDCCQIVLRGSMDAASGWCVSSSVATARASCERACTRSWSTMVKQLVGWSFVYETDRDGGSSHLKNSRMSLSPLNAE